MQRIDWDSIGPGEMKAIARYVGERITLLIHAEYQAQTTAEQMIWDIEDYLRETD
ncbi:MAG TPA: hypothetical protein VKA47_11020 [Solirubrobacterales bacterium]|nr:hypothetical protein [Solirubrobacterales bacterium]